MMRTLLILCLTFCPFISNAAPSAAELECATAVTGVPAPAPKLPTGAALRLELRRFQKVIGQKVLDMDEAVETGLIGLILGKPVIFQGPPGLAKSVLSSTIAELFGMQFAQVGINKEVFPSEVLGTMVPREGSRPVFEKGPMFTDVVILEELNRGSEILLYGLYQALQDHSVTDASGERHFFDDDHLVIATQNPLSSQGTRPLGDALSDRFLMQVIVPYPKHATEKQVNRNYLEEERAAAERGRANMSIPAMFNRGIIREARRAALALEAEPNVEDYTTALTQATRDKNQNTAHHVVEQGASVRGSNFLTIASRVHAFLAGHSAVTIADVDAVAVRVLAHRLIVADQGTSDQSTPENIIAQIMREVKTRLKI